MINLTCCDCKTTEASRWRKHPTTSNMFYCWSCSFKGSRNPFYGRKHSERFLIDKSLKMKGKKHHLGFKHSDEAKMQISAKKLGASSPMKDRKHKPESNLKNRLAHLGKQHTEEWKLGQSKRWTGVSNPRWAGGVVGTLAERIRHTRKNNQWKIDVFKRDNYTCQKCGRRGNGELNAHHIISFSSILQKWNIKTVYDALNCKDLWQLSNGQTLCKKCHDDITVYTKPIPISFNPYERDMHAHD